MATNQATAAAKLPADRRAKQAAIHCFAQAGLDGTSMEDVATAAGMARSTLYRYFREKDDLILAVMEQESVALAATLAAQIEPGLSFGEYIVEGVLLAVKHVPAHPVLSKMFAPDSLATSSRVALMSNRLTEVAIKVIEPEIQAAQQAGDLPASLTANMMMDWLIRIVFSLLTMPSDQTRDEAQTRVLLQTMLLPALSGQSHR